MPDAIAVSCSTVVDREDTKHIIELLSSKFPTIPIIVGGHEAYHNYEKILTSHLERDRIEGVFCIGIGLGQPYITNILKFAVMQKNSCHVAKTSLPLGLAMLINGNLHVTDTTDYNINDYAPFDLSLIKSVEIKDRDKPIDAYSFLGNTHAGNIKFLLGNNKDTVSYFPAFTSYGCGYNCTFCDTDPYLKKICSRYCC